jgi:outer membrane protein W
MRTLVITLLTLLLASAASAQQKNELSFFATNPGLSYSSKDGANASAGVGIAFDRMFTPRVSAQLSIASEQHHTYPYVVAPNGSIQQVTPRSFQTVPIDLAVQYHFLNDTHWQPYLGLGAHYVSAPHVGSQFRYQNHLGPEIAGGTVFRIGRSLGIVLDGKIALGDREHYDPSFRPSVGFTWRF